MDSAESSEAPSHHGVAPTAVKLLIAGGRGAGKTTFVQTAASCGVTAIVPGRCGADDRPAVSAAAIDIGRISLGPSLLVYLLGLPDHHRSRFAWDDLADNAIGAVVLADTRQLDGCFAAVDYLEHRRLPFVVAINEFDGVETHPCWSVRDALAVRWDTPIVTCDPRRRDATREILTALLRHAIARAAARPRGGVGRPHRLTIGTLSSRGHLSARSRNR